MNFVDCIILICFATTLIVAILDFFMYLHHRIFTCKHYYLAETEKKLKLSELWHVDDILDNNKMLKTNDIIVTQNKCCLCSKLHIDLRDKDNKLLFVDEAIVEQIERLINKEHIDVKA